MAREGRSHVRKRKKGCLVGCLTNLLLVLGVAALLFVDAHVLGFVKSDPQTGAPTLRFDNLPEIKLGDFDLSKIELPDVSKLTEKLPKRAYGVNPNGLTIKTLRAGDGEAVLSARTDTPCSSARAAERARHSAASFCFAA